MFIKKLAIASILVLGGSFLSVVAGTSGQASAQWGNVGLYQEIVARDCRNCEEEVGINISCQGTGRLLHVSVPIAATERGRAGDYADISFNIDGQIYKFSALAEANDLVGLVPVFEMPIDDPLMYALRSGRNASVRFKGSRGGISLKGSRDILEIFDAHCRSGKNQDGYIDSGTGGNTNGADNDERTRIIKQALQNQMPIQRTTNPNRSPNNNRNNTQTNNRNQNNNRNNTQTNNRGQSNNRNNGQNIPDYALWTLITASSGASDGIAVLTYGLPETDARTVVATCGGDVPPGFIRMDLVVYAGNRASLKRANVKISVNGRTTDYRGLVFNDSSEHAGVRLLIPADDSLLGELSTGNPVNINVDAGGEAEIPANQGADKISQFTTFCNQ